jgi:hypothetical protein
VTEIQPAQGNKIASDLQQIEGLLLSYLDDHGLPTEGVLAPVVQRAATIANLELVLVKLGLDQRARSTYVSKFVAATSAGLFDAALNYLWDETIAELRTRMVGYDLKYFFDVAEQNPERRKRLKDESDLDKISMRI